VYGISRRLLRYPSHQRRDSRDVWTVGGLFRLPKYHFVDASRFDFGTFHDSVNHMSQEFFRGNVSQRATHLANCRSYGINDKDFFEQIHDPLSLFRLFPIEKQKTSISQK
jgi:hypothetical protein